MDKSDIETQGEDHAREIATSDVSRKSSLKTRKIEWPETKGTGSGRALLLAAYCEAQQRSNLRKVKEMRVDATKHDF